jgi:hypothetical protein
MQNQSIVFLLAEYLQYLEEERNDVGIEDDGTKDVVVQAEFFVLSAEDELGVDCDIGAVDDSEEEGHTHHNQAALQEDQVNQSNGQSSPRK